MPRKIATPFARWILQIRTPRLGLPEDVKVVGAYTSETEASKAKAAILRRIYSKGGTIPGGGYLHVAKEVQIIMIDSVR